MKQLRATGSGGIRAVARWLAGATVVAMGAASGGAFAAEQTVHRCEIDGRVIFQQKPCAPGQAARVVAVPAPNIATAPVSTASRPAAPALAPAAAAAASAPAPPAPRPVSDEQLCLTYLRPLLRDPDSARIVTSAREGRILRVQLQAADAHGRLHTREAACEFFNGRIDEGWSRIQLERLGWFARWVVHGSGRAARHAARAREESIEAPPP